MASRVGWWSRWTGVVLPVAALVAIAALAATGAGLLMPEAELGPVATLGVRLGGLALAAAGLVALRTHWGRAAQVASRDLAIVLVVAVAIFATLAVLSVAHSDVTFSGGGEGGVGGAPVTELPDVGTGPRSSTTVAPGPSTQVEQEPPAEDSDRSNLVQVLLVGLLLLALLAVALGGLLLAWGVRPRFRRGRTLSAGPPESGVDAESAEAGLAASLAAVVEGDDPRAAIVAAYARLLEALAAAGGSRRPEEAPHEHLSRVLGPLGVRPEPVHELAELFVLARFSDHAVTDGHRATAVTLLETALMDLRASTMAAATAATSGPGADERSHSPGPA